jgi:hypothetical protein
VTATNGANSRRKRVDLGRDDLEVVPHASVRLEHQPADLREIAALERIGARLRALVLGHNVPRPMPQIARQRLDLGKELAMLCRRAENEFVGVPTGIMDQFTSALARADHALLLDCRDLSYRHIAIPAGLVIVVCDSRMERRLASSGYADRRRACDDAADRGAAERRRATIAPSP